MAAARLKTTALDGVAFTVEPGTAVGLIGPNGAGKTTLFNCLTRRCTPDAGTVRFEDEDLLALPPHSVAGRGIARTFQNLGLFPRLSGPGERHGRLPQPGAYGTPRRGAPAAPRPAGGEGTT
ncbi:ATP-binding cassette domain-containing protein [Streptomyces sp. NBC_00443]|uniref:ATP-binding cassette domain-containing protein n=1 Tax=Streptomyces sp. NBC_00443 TaxID=2975743 RepID=UPI003FA7EB57